MKDWLIIWVTIAEMMDRLHKWVMMDCWIIWVTLTEMTDKVFIWFMVDRLIIWIVVDWVFIWIMIDSIYIMIIIRMERLDDVGHGHVDVLLSISAIKLSQIYVTKQPNPNDQSN